MSSRPHSLIAAATTERQFQESLRRDALTLGWRYYHVLNAGSRGSAPGWPDVVLCKPPLLVIAEIKREGKEPTAAQRGWLEALSACTELHVALWRPSDQEAISVLLATGRVP